LGVGKRQHVGPVDEEGHVVPTELGGGADVIVVAVGGQRGNRALAFGFEHRVDAFGREARIDDHGLVGFLGPQHPAIGLERVVGEDIQEHGKQSLATGAGWADPAGLPFWIESRWILGSAANPDFSS
jgi:hypothetical protein